MSEVQEQAIRQQCKALRMPTIGGQFARLAEAAIREKQSHVGYLEALLAAEMEEREARAIARLLHEARLPRMKTLEGFEFDRSGVSPAQLRDLAVGDYVAKAEPILLIGEAGTGKTHLATGLCVAACRQRRRVRFTTLRLPSFSNNPKHLGENDHTSYHLSEAFNERPQHIFRHVRH